jgi:hypothetical protein
LQHPVEIGRGIKAERWSGTTINLPEELSALSRDHEKLKD